MSSPLLDIGLPVSLALCGLGLVWRASDWFRVRIGPETRGATSIDRLATAIRGAASTLLSRHVVRALGSFVADALLLRRLLAASWTRWLAHLFIVVGFAALLFVHALAPIVTSVLFPGYQPTLDPYLFLRNLFGVMTLGGIVLLLAARRWARSPWPPPRERAGAAFATLLVVVIASGFALEAHKIASPRAFERMTDQFVGAGETARLAPLRSVWASEFGVAFGGPAGPVDKAHWEAGRSLHGEACAACHDRPASAFVSYPVARMMAPVTAWLDRASAERWLLDLHVAACLIGLATLPFTRFFHAVASPLSLLARAARRHRGRLADSPSVAALATRRALAHDACVRCGLCDLECSVAPLARLLGNPHLLPSHKLVATRAAAAGRLELAAHADDAERVAEGALLCTDCGRCTAACPVGLDLADLWQAGRGDLAAAGLAAPALRLQAHPELAWIEAREPVPGPPTPSRDEAALAPLAADRSSFSRCVQCQTCTNVCPVVAHGIGGDGAVDLTPQRVMNLLRLGLPDLALGSRMVWSCATCYQCQEHCPEGIRVTDIMCELRGLAVARLQRARKPEEAA